MVTRGRPRSFDRDAALQAAMKTFWQFGYEGASMAALTEAMGINSPSLYAAFGSKEQLFREAVDLYLATEDKKTRGTLAEQRTARGAVEAMLERSVANLTNADGCRGCLLVLSPEASDTTPDVQGTRIAAHLAGQEAAGDQASRIHPIIAGPQGVEA